MRAAVLAVAVLFAAAPDMSGATVQPLPYWKQHGCDHSHRSQVAKHRITLLLHHQGELRPGAARAVRHYSACVTTPAKARYLRRHARQQWEWRRANVCTATHGNAALGRCMAARDYRWGDGQFSCLDALWGGRESGWSVYAHNSSSGAHGIPQALPGSRMGPGWWDDPFVQIRWGLGYIAGRYGTPCGALGHSNVTGWY